MVWLSVWNCKLSCLLQLSWRSSINRHSICDTTCVWGHAISNTKRSLINQNICYGCNTSASVCVGRLNQFWAIQTILGENKHLYLSSVESDTKLQLEQLKKCRNNIQTLMTSPWWNFWYSQAFGRVSCFK